MPRGVDAADAAEVDASVEDGVRLRPKKKEPNDDATFFPVADVENVTPCCLPCRTARMKRHWEEVGNFVISVLAVTYLARYSTT